MTANDDAPHPLDVAWDALEAGSPEGVLEALAAALSALEPEDQGEATLLEVLARLSLADLAGARSALERAAEVLTEDDPNLARARGELLVSEWRLDDARAVFEALDLGPDADPAVLERLALLADHAGRQADAERYLERARGEAPLALTPEEFEAVVESAAAALPDAWRDLLQQVPVVIEPVPHADLVQDPLETPPDLLGLFLGSPLGEETLTGEQPTHIRIFQRNLERIAADREDLEHEIGVTLFHELGHALGLDEDAVDRLGLA